MRYCVFVLWLIPVLCNSCSLLPEEEKPKGLEERALDSEIVLAAYTRAVYKLKNDSSSYSAEFLVFNVIKGEEHVVELYQKRKPSELETVLNRRLVNVSNFGDPSKCDSDVNPNETYILLLDVLANGELAARYDGAYGPAVLYTRDKETALEAIGSSPWSEWSPCSASCGGGIQQRRRQCDGSSSKCSNEDGQQRTCNMFPCTGILNALEAAGVHRSTLHPSGRPSAYKLLPSGSWRSLEEEITFPRTFPWEFSLLLTVRVKPSSTGGFLLRVLHSGSLQVGLYISDILTLVLSDKNNIRVSFVKSLFDDHWHQLAFSVRRNTVSFYLDCEYSAKLPLSGKIRPFGGQPATIIVGSTGNHELDAFQGDVEQITITGSPDAAEKQCNSTTQPFVSRTGTYALRQEVRSKPTVSSKPLNDQLPLRGDILIDDEDFSFEFPGSGEGSLKSDDDYSDYDDKTTATKEKDKIPLKSETVDEMDEDDDEDYDENDDDKDYDDEEEEEENKYEEKNNDDESDEKDVSDTMKNYNDATVDERTHLKDKKQDNDDDDGWNYETKSSSKDQTLSNTTDDSNLEHISKTSYDFSHVDEEDDSEEDTVEGSGSETQVALSWSEWSPCSSTCNWGRRTRTSYCSDNGLDLEKCTAASSKRSETEACFLRLCPSTTESSTTDIISSTPAPLRNISVINFKSQCRVPCRNGGICQPPYKCLCPHGFYGSLCQYVKQACRVKCRNGGTCHPPSTCICPKGYVGNECQYPLCKPYCMNGGTCIAPNTCSCKPGYVGNSCYKAVCQQGCNNGGHCIAPNKCACRSGFTGHDCNQPHCDPECQNGGECVKPYFCHCPSGTKGAFCEKFLCKPDCQNGGVCIGPGKCSCPRGYTGHSCEQAYCPGGCLNGGICTKSGKCSCTIGYTGTNCEKKKPCKFVEVKEPFKRGYKQKVTTQVKVPCGAWGWKLCTKTKVHYEMVYKTFYKTAYECEGFQQRKYLDYQKGKKEK